MTTFVEPHPTAYLSPRSVFGSRICRDERVELALSVAASFSFVYSLPPMDMGWGVFGCEGGLELAL